MISIPLHSGWTLHSLGGPVPEHISGQVIPAQVPGTVHTDLLAAGLINDPYVGLEEKALEWVHTTDWLYATTFTSELPAPGEIVDLAFDGLDTVARIVLNGREVSRTFNMHRSYRFDVTEYIVAGENSLEVEFASALNYAWSEADRVGIRPRAYDHPFNMVRKMACSFGWDWGPDLQTAGIWKPARLEKWTTVRSTQTRTLVTVDSAGTGHVEVIMDLQWAPTPISDESPAVVLNLAVGAGHGSQAVSVSVPVERDSAAAVAHVEIPDVALWWPAGYGEQPLFDLDATLVCGGEERARYERRIGFRTVEVNTTPDDLGTPFVIRVNGTDVFIKGANWIPDDHLLTRITRDQLALRADQALESNMNLLRIWGGGIYESEDFYDVCDERGLLVWQDFLLACAAYPEEAPFTEEFEAEARDNVARLTPHASLVLWNGGNENLWGFMDWKWQEELKGRSWGLGIYRDVFTRVTAELDPTRPYADGSPYSPGFTDQLSTGTTPVHPNDQAHGTRHEWEVWNRQDYLTHLDYVPRFCSEFGHQGPPTWSTLERSVSPQGRAKETEEFLLHQKAEVGNFKLDTGAAPHLPVPEDFEEWNWMTQVSQAHSVSFGIEHFRSFWPYTAGSIVWQINDCWPVTSWAAVDGDGREKPLFYALKHAYAPRLLTFKPRDDSAAPSSVGLGGVVGGGEGAVVAALGAKFGEDLPHGRNALGRPTLFASNDSDETWSGTLELRRENFAGEALATASIAVTVGPRETQRIEVEDALLAVVDQTGEVLVANLDGVRAFHYFEELKNLKLEANALSADIEAAEDAVVVTLTASSLVVDSAVIADRVHPDAKIDDQLVTLRAGESRTFALTVRSEQGRKDGIGEYTGAEVSVEDLYKRLAEALNDPERAHVVIRSVNSIRA